MKYDLFIFNGHGEGDKGACYNGYKENEIAQKLVKRIIEIMKEYNINVHTNNGLNNYNRNLTKGNEYKHVEGLCVHLNASANHNAYGSEIIVPCKLANMSLQENILKELNNIGFKNRGIKSRDYNTENFIMRKNGSGLNNMDWYREIREAKNNGFYLSILEVCFIDSSDMTIFNNNFEKICQAIVKCYAIKYGWKKSIKENVNNNVNGNDDVFYRVVTGSFKNRENAEKQIEKLKQVGFDSFIEVKK